MSTKNQDQNETYRKVSPAWFFMVMVGVIILPNLLTTLTKVGLELVNELPGVVVDVAEFAGDALGDLITGIGDLLDSDSSINSGEIAPLFTDEVAHWQDDIARWAQTYDLDPNLLATVMQIESCGHPTVSSVAGAQGLFQVMPFHFATNENPLDPNTNAMRGAGVLNECLRLAEGDVGLAMACYNGGPSVLYQEMSTWYDEPRRYYYWGTGIYADAQNNAQSSPRLDEWLNAGGARLCDLASAELGLN